MIIIIGTRPRETLLEVGDFFCPRCGEKQPYNRKQISQYATFFFVPLFKLRTLGVFVECQHCRRAYEPDILNRKLAMPTTELATELLMAIRAELETGTPVELVEKKLVQAGWDMK
jgi:hypothetical protein